MVRLRFDLIFDPRIANDNTVGIEGTWDECMTIIGQCHTLVHTNGVVRIQSDIRVGTRTDKKQGFKDKVKAVENLLAQDDK